MRNLRRILAAFAVLCCLCILAVPVAAARKDVEIEIVSVETDYDAVIVFDITNNTENNGQFGWVHNTARVYTEYGHYDVEIPGTFAADSTTRITVTVPGCASRVTKVVLNEIILLDGKLPMDGKTLSDVTIYDDGGSVTAYSADFPEATDPMASIRDQADENMKNMEKFQKQAQDRMSGMMVVGACMVGVFFIGAVVLVVVLLKKQTKNNKSASQTFMPFAGQSMNNDMAQQMHNQAHQMHMQAHQQAVQTHTHQQVDQFMHQSSTPTDMGGFNPPPPPPPTGF